MSNVTRQNPIDESFDDYSLPAGGGHERSKQKPLRSLRLTPEGWVFIVIMAFITFGAILRNVNLLIILAGMMFSSLMINWRFAVNILRTLDATRALPSRVHAGRLTNIIWRVNNHSLHHTMWNINVEDRIDDISSGKRSADDVERLGFVGRRLQRISDAINRRRRADTNQIRLSIPRINPGGCESSVYQCLIHRRGIYQTGPAVVSTTYPFGFIQLETKMVNTEVLYVSPALGKLTPDWNKRAAATAFGAEATQRKRGTQEDEFFALRQWRSGDSRKNIHWRSTAKMQRPMVKQFDQPSNRDLAILIDLYQNGGEKSQRHQHDPRNEILLSFAATVASHSNPAVEGRISIAVCGQQFELFRNVRQPDVNRHCLQHLAIAQPGDAADLQSAISAVGGSVSRGTPIIVASSRHQPDWLIRAASPQTVGQRVAGNSTDLDRSIFSSATSSLAAPELKLQKLSEQVHWLQAESDEFRQLFSVGEITDDAEIQQLAQRHTKP